MEALLIEKAYPKSHEPPSRPVAIWNRCSTSSTSQTFSVVAGNRPDFAMWNHKIDGFRKLKSGWNGYDAEPPSAVAIDTAKSFLFGLMGDTYDPCRVAPSVVGGVGITHKGNGRRVYVEFFNDGDILALFSDDVEEPASKRVKPTYRDFHNLTAEIRAYLDA